MVGRIGGMSALLALIVALSGLGTGFDVAAAALEQSEVETPDDSLNAAEWMKLSQKALKSGREDLAKVYFDKAIRITKQLDSIRVVKEQESKRISQQQDSIRAVKQQDSLQNARKQEALNPATWISSGRRQLKSGKEDSAKIYFDLAIKLSSNAKDTIVKVGLILFESGRLETSLPYLLANPSAMDPGQLDRLENTLVNSTHLSAALVFLRYHASQNSQFSPQAATAAKLAFSQGQFLLCRNILSPFAEALDTGSVSRLLLSNFYLSGKMDPAVIQKAAARSNISRVRSLAAMNLALLGDFKGARTYLSGGTPQPVQSFVKAQELDAVEKSEKSIEYYKEALQLNWPEFHAIVQAEFYNHYASTGNRLKADKLWDSLNGSEDQQVHPHIRELLAFQLGLRGHEKQSNSLYRRLYTSHPNRSVALQVLWEQLIGDDPEGLNDRIQALLKIDPMDCQANELGMRYAKALKQTVDLIRYGANVMLYCPDAVEPALDLAGALQSLGREDAAKVYYAKYIERGGDKSNVPALMR